MSSTSTAAPALSEISRRRLSDRIFGFPALLAGILVARACWTCRSNIVDIDMWWHLRNAAYLLANHRLPNIDTYSFTVAGTPWMSHEWLGEIPFLLGFRVLGLRGLFVVTFLCVAVLSLSLFQICRVRTSDPLAAALATIAAGVLGMISWSPRPQLLGWLCFTAIYAILLLYREHRTAKLWLIPPLFCLWINCHGGWAYGLIVFAIVIAAGLLPEDVGLIAARPWSRTELKQLLTTLGASVALLFVNPFGYKLVWYPLDYLFRQKLNTALVEEWQSVNFNDERGMYVFAILAAVFLFAVLQRRRWHIDEVLLAGFALYGGLAHLRMLLPAGIILAPILAPHMEGLSAYDPRQERRLINGILLAGVAGFLVFAFPREAMLQKRLPEHFPVNATHFIRAHPLDGPVFNYYEWGGYLEWELPQMKMFIDSRVDIFEYKGVLRDYVKIATLNDSEELLDRYAIRYVLYAPTTGLAYHLGKSPAWREIYRDHDAVLFARVAPLAR